MLDLWQLFVVDVFGGFWLSVLGLALIIYIILAVFGKVSANSTLSYLTLFLFAMAYGYGKAIFTIPIAVAILLYFGMQVYSVMSKQQ